MRTRKTKQTMQLDVPIEAAWTALFEPQAMMWMSDRSVFAAAKPGDTEALGALRFGWRRSNDGLLGVTTYEVFDIERHRRLTLRQRSALRPINVEFRVKPHQGGTRATVTVNLRRTYFRWLNIRTPMYLFVGRLMDGWRLAVAGGVPTPDSPRSLLAGPIDNVQEEALEAQIQAPVDVIWELVEDVDGVGLPGGDDTHPDGDDSDQWRQPDGDGELFFVVLRSDDDDRLLCSLSQIVRHSAFHVSVKGPAYETVHELIPGAVSHLLRITYRWEDRHTVARDSHFTDRRLYVEGIKAAAEARGPRKVR